MKNSTQLRLWLILPIILWHAALALAQNFTLSGICRTPNGNFLQEYQVELIDATNGNVITTADFPGGYSFNVPLGETVTIQPSKDDNPVNGVSTLDMVLIARHLSGVQPFTSPYQYIAADVDGDGVVGLNDTTELYKLILGIYTELPNNSSWRFVPASYVFPNPTNPFPFPSVITAGPLTGPLLGLDFIAVKVGDVNGTALENGGGPGGGGSPYTRVIYGEAKIDANANCVADSAESPVANWIVTAHDGVDEYYATTRSDGAYNLFAPPGVYKVWLTPPNSLWDVCPDTIFNLDMTVTTSTPVNFAATAVGNCALMTVELSTPFLRRCFNNGYIVQYCNQGTEVAEDARVEVTLDPYFNLLGSSISYSNVSGNTYSFPVGDVAPGACAYFNIWFKLSCDATLGQTHCTTAAVYPDSLCGPTAWSGGNLEITAECNGDDVVFTVTNTGAAMTQAVDYVVIEDVMVQMVSNGSILLNTDESQTITLPANGSTWRLEVDQPSGFPWNTVTSASLEGCGENSQGVFSLGFVTLFPNNDESPFEDEDCLENMGAFDPNDKQGFPRGVNAGNFVPKDQDMEYLIRFQNTGTDTAFQVIILDTLSHHLNPASIRPLAASHAYTWQVLGAGVVQFVFDNIMLPDSNVNEPASHGFIKFAIKPQPNLPDPTVVQNEAAIFFDFNLPVITNRTLHTFGEQYLSVNNVTFRPDVSLSVWPNPVSTLTTFALKSATPYTGNLLVFDAQGRQIAVQPFTSNEFQWDASGLMPGLYFFRLETSDGAGIGAGSMQVIR